MEFADWPLPHIAAALLRAEADYLSSALRPTLSDAVRADLVDAIALAWLRHDPSALPAAHQRLALRVEPSLGLWRERLAQQAERTKLWPPDHLVLREPSELVAFEARWGLTASRRMRACLTLAARIRGTEPPWR